MSARVLSVGDAVNRIPDDAVVVVSSSSGLCCPDPDLKALGERFGAEGRPRNLTMVSDCSFTTPFTVPREDNFHVLGGQQHDLLILRPPGSAPVSQSRSAFSSKCRHRTPRLPESAYGYKQTFRGPAKMSALPPTTDTG